MSKLNLVKILPEDFQFYLFTDLTANIYGATQFTSSFDSENPFLHSCYVLLQEQQAVGRFAIYINPALRCDGNPSICIGAYACYPDDNIAMTLMQHAKRICKELGYNYAVGPMNGSTWDAYRFSLNEDKDSFLMDVHQPSYYNSQFTNSGFEQIASYKSNVLIDLSFDQTQLDKFESYFLNKGACFRNISMTKVEDELYDIARFCNQAFADNFLFTETDPAEFIRKYMKAAPYFDPSLIWIVENDEGAIQALLFAIPDKLDPSGETLIIKTMACLPNTKFRGVSTYLARKSKQIAVERGFKKIIHALFLDDNLSEKASKNMNAMTHKQYALYGLDLENSEV